MEFKTLSIEELKAGYMDRHGFIFIGAAICDKNNCDKLSNILKSSGYTEELVEFVVALNDTTYVFVYPEGISFDCPSFMQKAQTVGMMMRAWQVDTLTSFLKNN